MAIVVEAFGFGLITASIVALGAVGFTLQFATTNVLNLAYGAIMTLAAFAVYYCNRAGLSVWLGLPIGGLIGGAASVLLNRLLLVQFIRRGVGLFGMLIVTLAVGVIIDNVILAVGGPEAYNYNVAPGRTLHLLGMRLTTSQLGIMLLAVLTMLMLHVVLAKTKFGKALRAAASDPTLARACGINTGRMTEAAWAISGVMCGLAGVTLVINTITFGATTGTDFAIIIIAAAILGGVGQPYGAMLGALIVGLTTEISAVYISPEYKNAIAYVLLILVLLARPGGLLGRAQREVAM